MKLPSLDHMANLYPLNRIVMYVGICIFSQLTILDLGNHWQYVPIYIIESVDSISRDGQDVTTLTFNCVLRVIHLVRLSLQQQTVIYIQNRQVPKIVFSPSSSFAFRQTNSRTHECLAPFLISICSVYYKAGLRTLTFSQISRTFE